MEHTMTEQNYIKDVDGLKTLNKVTKVYNELMKEVDNKFSEWSHRWSIDIIIPTLELIKNQYEVEEGIISISPSEKNSLPIISLLYTMGGDLKLTGRIEFCFSKNRKVRVKILNPNTPIPAPITNEMDIDKINYKYITETVTDFFNSLNLKKKTDEDKEV